MNTRILIDAAIQPGQEGGIEQYLIGLTRGLATLSDGREDYTFITAPGAAGWLKPHGGINQRFISKPKPVLSAGEFFKRGLGPLRGLAGMMWRGVSRRIPPQAAPRVPLADQFWEQLGGDVLHIVYPQTFFQSNIPTVFTIHDLQHRHLPEFFSPSSIEWREVIYPFAFRHAKSIVTISHWVKEDLIRQYDVPAGKIHVVPLASGTEGYERVGQDLLRRVANKFGLPADFALYPALTYGHKNHIRLLESLALLRDREGLRISLICTGRQKLYWPHIERRLEELGLGSQVRFLGFVSSSELRALFHLARFMVFPSLFEGAGIPLVEAFAEGLPVACSDIPPFREYGADVPLFFDPRSVENIAETLCEIDSDAELRESLRERGRKRAAGYSWQKAAQEYRAVYRRTAPACEAAKGNSRCKLSD